MVGQLEFVQSRWREERRLLGAAAHDGARPRRLAPACCRGPSPAASACVTRWASVVVDSRQTAHASAWIC